MKNFIQKNVFLSAVIIFSIAIISGCCKNDDKVTSKQYLSNLKSSQKTSKKSVSPMRINMLRDTALSVGARGGLAHRAKSLNAITENFSKLLFRVFNFNAMLLEKNILPPILIEGRNSLDLESEDLIRVADRNYQIISQARFVTAPPTWRAYLILNYKPPAPPNKSLLPKTKGEQIVWKNFIEKGWAAGIAQAELIYQENVDKLVRDYKGMVLYSNLLAQNMVTKPYVATLDLGVTGNESSLNVNDRILRITAKPKLQSNSNKWKTQVTRHD